MESSWSITEAKKHLAELIDAALTGEAQIITKRGKRLVAIIAVAGNERLTGYNPPPEGWSRPAPRPSSRDTLDALDDATNRHNLETLKDTDELFGDLGI